MSYINNAAVIEYINAANSDAKRLLFSDLKMLRKLAKAAGLDVPIGDWLLTLVFRSDMTLQCCIRFGENGPSSYREELGDTVLLHDEKLENVYLSAGSDFVRTCLDCI